MNHTPHVGIIGAGLGALSSAIVLAASGLRVEVFEKNESAGGKASEIRRDGFRFDTGPSLLTMPFVVDEIFSLAGKPREEVLEFIPVEPLCRYTFSDGSILNASSDEEAFIEAVREFAPNDAEAVRRFLEYSERIYERTSDIFLFNRLDDMKALLRFKHLGTLLRIWNIDPFRSVHSAVSSFFQDERLIQLFDRYATYNGSDPYRAPATLNIIPYVEYRLGGYYVRGGMYALVRALLALALDLGVVVHYNAEVDRIIVEGGRAVGFHAGGESMMFDAVVSNADAIHTMTRLLEDARYGARYTKLEPSCSGCVFLWGVRGESKLPQHNIFFSSDYRREFRNIFHHRMPPDDPTVYVSITSRAEPDHAAPGYENWFVLVNMPALTETNRDIDIASLRDSILRRVASSGIDVHERIVNETVITPVDLEQRYNAYLGSIYGISSNSPTAAFLRAGNRVRALPGLYLCGGAAHPGGGVPLVLLSGRLAAQAVLQDTGKRSKFSAARSRFSAS